jgi:hypothetical protein
MPLGAVLIRAVPPTRHHQPIAAIHAIRITRHIMPLPATINAILIVTIILETPSAGISAIPQTLPITHLHATFVTPTAFRTIMLQSVCSDALLDPTGSLRQRKRILLISLEPFRD